jgi:signal transduction histidine kinase
MNTSMPLRRRVMLACTLLGLLLSMLFATATVVVSEDYEHILAAEILHGQAEDYSLRLANAPHAATVVLPLTHRLSGYRAGDANVPLEYAKLPQGVHEDPAREGMHVGVFDTAAGRLLFVVDLSDIEQLERHLAWFLAGMVAVGTAMAGWLGWLLAGGALAPVGRLANAVDALPVRPQRTTLAAHVSQDELGRLAGAIDDYQARMAEADEHEQVFLADASHELRTPIAVVQGAAEVLLDEPAQEPATRQRLLRMDRGIRELTDLLDVLLGLARRNPLQVDALDAGLLLREASDAVAAARPDLVVQVDAGGELMLPRREALLLLRSTIRHVVPPDVAGTLRLRLRAPCIEIGFDTDTDASVRHDSRRPAGTRSDTRRGLTLIDRLAQHSGMRIEDEPGYDVRIRLPGSAFATTPADGA